MAHYAAEDDVNFLSNYVSLGKADHMSYMGEPCVLISHKSVEKSKFDIEEMFINGKRKKVLSYDNNTNTILVTPLLEAPFGCSSFDGTKYTMPLSMPTSKNKYTHSELDLEQVASFKKLLNFMDKQVRTTQAWNEMTNYMPIIRPSQDPSKYPDRLRVKVISDESAGGFKSVFYNATTGVQMSMEEVPKHAACVCALRVTPIWRMPDGRYGYTLELVRADVHVRSEGSTNSSSGSKEVVEPTPSP